MFLCPRIGCTTCRCIPYRTKNNNQDPKELCDNTLFIKKKEKRKSMWFFLNKHTFVKMPLPLKINFEVSYIGYIDTLFIIQKMYKYFVT